MNLMRGVRFKHRSDPPCIARALQLLWYEPPQVHATTTFMCSYDRGKERKCATTTGHT